MAVKSRYQNPTINDTVKLQLFVFNSNNTANVNTINKVDIYFLDPTMMTPINPEGRVLIQSIPGGSVVMLGQGEYELSLFLDPTLYLETGRYIDEWFVIFEVGDPETTLDHLFTVYPKLWYTTPIPVVYDFSFYFQPNKFRKGTKKSIEIEIIPNVPRASDLCQYYENLAIAADLLISIGQHCNECVPCEQDLQLIVDNAPTDYREKNRAFYRIDTDDFDCGVYDIWFTLNFGNNTYVSEKNQFSVFD